MSFMSLPRRTSYAEWHPPLVPCSCAARGTCQPALCASRITPVAHPCRARRAAARVAPPLSCAPGCRRMSRAGCTQGRRLRLAAEAALGASCTSRVGDARTPRVSDVPSARRLHTAHVGCGIQLSANECRGSVPGRGRSRWLPGAPRTASGTAARAKRQGTLARRRRHACGATLAQRPGGLAVGCVASRAMSPVHNRSHAPAKVRGPRPSRDS